MATNPIKNLKTALPGLILILILASVLTYGGTKAVAEATKPKPAATKTVVVSKTEGTTDASTSGSVGDKNVSADLNATTKTQGSTASSSSSAASSTPAQPTTKTAKTNSFVYLRPTASTGGAPLQDLQAGTEVQYESKTGTLWQKVTVDGKEGYVYVKYLTY